MVIRCGSGVLRNKSEQARASPVLARTKSTTRAAASSAVCCCSNFEHGGRCDGRPTKHGPCTRRSRSGRYLPRLALLWCDYSTSLVERNHPVVGGCVVRGRWAVLLEARRATAALVAAHSPFRSCSALPPQLFRITSALLPHCFRTASALLPHCFRTASALLSHCFRTASALLAPSVCAPCSIAIFLCVACFLCSVCLEPFY